ncbi:MAG: RNA polymerase sigma factor FliA [Burkholderiales bacterium]|nr:RNA polymerase sigma factor FliA [Burkholderiales bacterium]
MDRRAISRREAALAEYAPLVRRIAHHLLARLPSSVSLDDIVQAGMIGLMDALGRFEEGQGTQFATYASQRIRGAMLDELRGHDWLPRAARKSMREIDAALGRLQQRLGRSPSEAEIAADLKVPLATYQQMLQDAKGHQLVHLEDFSDGEDENLLERSVAAEGAENPLAMLQDKRFRGALVTAIADLPERENTVMGLYYEQELNFREIAAVLGVTESRVCQIHTQAVARLRAALQDWREAS